MCTFVFFEFEQTLALMAEAVLTTAAAAKVIEAFVALGNICQICVEYTDTAGFILRIRRGCTTSLG